MEFKNNLKQLMEEKQISQYGLDKICNLQINTIRKLINNPQRNTSLESLRSLAQALDCNIKDLIEDNPSVLDYDRISEANKERPIFMLHQVFSPENIKYLRQLLLEVGVSCSITPTSKYRTATIKNEYVLSSIQLDLNLRVSEANAISRLQVINFYVCVNSELQNELLIKDALIRVLEIYARKLNINEICFIIDQDFEREDDNYSNTYSNLPSEFSFTLGTQSSLFNVHKYENCPSSTYHMDEIVWRKTLN